MSAANQYDRQNDAELGSGIFDKTAKVEKPLPRCACGNLIENPWYGDIDCYECQRELKAEYKRTLPMVEDAVSTLMDAVIVVYGECVPQDWPWTDEDMRDEILNRYPD